MKENQEISHKQVGYQFPCSTSTKNSGSLSMVNDGEKIGNSWTKEKQQLSEDCIKSLLMVDDVDKTTDKKSGLSGREKLKRHWKEVGGRICVPERWGHEASLREWMDCSSFDKILAPNGLKSAHEALISQGKPARSTSRMIQVRSR
ncbi:unnamed protein product [Withania somnifera]